jgi:hypothetical protein
VLRAESFLYPSALSYSYRIAAEIRKGVMEQGADGYRCHLPEAACIVFQNGACFSLHGL